jgi:hypothetical protein
VPERLGKDEEDEEEVECRARGGDREHARHVAHPLRQLLVPKVEERVAKKPGADGRAEGEAGVEDAVEAGEDLRARAPR